MKKMTRIILSGCNGKMGKFITDIVDSRDDCEIVAGVDKDAVMLSSYPVFSAFSDIKCEADVIIDFSHPSVLSSLLSYVHDTNTPAVIATTGFDEKQTEMIKETAKTRPIFFSFNMTLGINLLADLLKKATAVLADSFDIEIIEAHHNQKIDAPSGTAIMLANAINEQLEETYELKYDRHSVREKRPKKEIGMHAVRGGTIVGEHEVIFAGRDEIITLSHSARSKEVFAVGAVKAAVFIVGKGEGMYSMTDLIAEQ